MSWRCWVLLSCCRCVLLFYFLCRSCVWAWRFKCAFHSFVCTNTCALCFLCCFFVVVVCHLFTCRRTGLAFSAALSLSFFVIGMNYVTLNIINNIVKWIRFLFAVPERQKKRINKIVLFTRHRFGCAIFHVSLMCKQNVCIAARYGTAYGPQATFRNFLSFHSFFLFLCFSLLNYKRGNNNNHVKFSSKTWTL